MSENTKHDSARRDEIEMMLPFYVTGQLAHAEANEIVRAEQLERLFFRQGHKLRTL